MKSILNTYFSGLIVLCCTLLTTHGLAADPVGYGDGVLHLGTNGYASLPDNQFQGFNSSKDFSLEVALNIEANAAGGRWPILLGKKYSPPFSDPGFALSINQGQFTAVGQQIHAAVADGTNKASLTSRSFQGAVHAVMTWSASEKLLQLYINGVMEGSTTNTLINSSALVNNEDFKLGGPSNCGQTLQRDVFFGRLWNRNLRADEVQSIWTIFDSSGLHILPNDFDRTLLVSEWLMEQLNDSAQLKDTSGVNDLLLQGAASAWNGSGPLVLHSPPNGATGISKSITLKSTGGIDKLGSNAIHPMQYEIQVDEVDTFNSTNLRSSGWQAHYAMWKPRLKPSTRYFWRVRVKDSSSIPLVSDYSASSSFTTKPPSDWYVRPGKYASFNSDTGVPIPTPGVYGVQDGTSYYNAWNGTFSILWGEGGVEPGDSLYICGKHYYTLKNNNWPTVQARAYVSESGYSSDFPITIRMDYSNDPGVMWGAALNDVVGEITWQGPDGKGVYWSTNLKHSADYCLNGTDVVLLDRETAPTWDGHLGASFMTNNVWYVKAPDGASPAGRILKSNSGYRFDLGRSHFICFYRCRFFNSAPTMDIAGWDLKSDTQTRLPLSTYITFDGCELRYNSELTLTPGHDHWTIKNSELSYSPYGIYTFLNKRSIGANYLTVQSNYIHDMGTVRFPHVDAHGVGIQGGEGHLIEGNRIEDTGAAIEFWTYSQPMRSHIIRYNYIKNIHVMPITGGGGIVISGDNIASVTGLRTGIKIYGNIIMNTGLGATETWQGEGISSSSKDYIEINNNVIYNASWGIWLGVVNSPTQARIANNIIVNPRSKYLVIMGTGTSSNLFIDYNLFFPAVSLSNNSSNFIVSPNAPHNQHSIFADPQFVSNVPSNSADFCLRPESPAIDGGIDVGLSRDIIGSSLPMNTAPDIGAYEISTPYKPLSSPKNPRLNPLKLQ